MPEQNPQDHDPTKALIVGLMKHLVVFGAQVHAAREQARDKYRKAESEPRNRLRIIIDGLMAMLADAVTTPIAGVTESTSYQIGVSASYIRSHFLVTDLIMNGETIEAFVLIRKQLESLARLNELDSKPLSKLHGKTPNIQNALKGGAGRIYGDLSEIAHFGTPRVTEFLHVIEKGGATGPSLLPAYSEQSVACMDLCQFISLYFQLWLVEKLGQWYPSAGRDDLNNILGIAIATALEAGVIKEADGNAAKKDK